ncbi:hypothetical protein BJX99DRAFT_241029 [Aspergillus californicus]
MSIASARENAATPPFQSYNRVDAPELAHISLSRYSHVIMTATYIICRFLYFRISNHTFHRMLLDALNYPEHNHSHFPRSV